MWWVLITWFTSVFNCVELLLDCVVFFNWPNVFARGTWNWAPCAGKQPPMFPPSATDECDDWWVCTQGDLLGTNTLLVVEWRGPKDLCTVATPRIISEQYTSVVFCAEIILNYSHFRISLYNLCIETMNAWAVWAFAFVASSGSCSGDAENGARELANEWSE